MTIDIRKFEQIVKDSTPGKFEGEPAATAYYYEAMLNGDGEPVYSDQHYEDCPANGNADADCTCEDDDLLYTAFEITPEEREAFDFGERPTEARLYINEQGFVHLATN